MNRLFRVFPCLVGLLTFLLLIADARGQRAQRFGSNLRSPVNLLIGADLAPRLDAITGLPTLVPSGQTSCTLRDVGTIGDFRRTGSLVPANGVVTRVRVRSGPNPARLQVVIMSGSPGLYGTVVRASRPFRPRPNRITTVRVNLPVTRSISRNGVQVTDAVGLNVLGPGTMPISDQGTAGTFTPGTALTQLWYPLMRRNDPRVEGYTVDGLELLMQWEFVRARRQVDR